MPGYLASASINVCVSIIGMCIAAVAQTATENITAAILIPTGLIIFSGRSDIARFRYIQTCSDTIPSGHLRMSLLDAVARQAAGGVAKAREKARLKAASVA